MVILQWSILTAVRVCHSDLFVVTLPLKKWHLLSQQKAFDVAGSYVTTELLQHLMQKTVLSSSIYSPCLQQCPSQNWLADSMDSRYPVDGKNVPVKFNPPIAFLIIDNRSGQKLGRWLKWRQEKKEKKMKHILKWLHMVVFRGLYLQKGSLVYMCCLCRNQGACVWRGTGL